MTPRTSPPFVAAVAILFLAAYPPATNAAPRPGRNYAFLVACKKYKKTELRPLQYTQADIIAFYQVLRDSGFAPDNIVLMHDGQGADLLPEARKIRRELKLLLAELRKEDTLIVALSGHGIQFKGEKGAYFCPVDAELKDRTTLLAMEDLYAELKKCKAERKLLLVDACRNAPQSPLGKSRAEVDLEKLTGIAGVPVPRGVLALFSCSKGEQSYEYPDLKHGVFFYHVIKGWKGAAANRQGKVTLGGLTEYVMDATPRYARLNLKAAQVPEQRGEFSGIWVLSQAGAGPKEFTNSIDMKLVLIPAGKFTMGSPETEKDREHFGKGSERQHKVEITRPFYMGVYTVTQAQYRKVMGKNPSWFSVGGRGKAKVDGLDTEDFPVETVSWNDAQEFCEKLTELEKKKGFERLYRLPTEAEWEYACRGGAFSYHPFHLGDSLSSRQANFDGNYPYGGAGKWLYLERTAKVGSYKPNAFGLYDMHGNVWQWCGDRYDKDYYQESPEKNPQGPKSGTVRVLRGGSWFNEGGVCRSALRNGLAPGGRGNFTGFRVFCAAGLRTP